jgi:glycerophosphoryl diester phosphodiesterase
MDSIFVHHMAALNGQYPPNSLASIRACLEAEAAFIEVDITALADSDYLLVHDETLEAETTGVGAVAQCSMAVSEGLFFKSKEGNASAYHVPRLSQVVELFQHFPGQSRLQLDLKNVIPFSDDEPLRRLVRLIEPLGDRVIVSSSADWQLRRLYRLAYWLELGFDIHFYIDWRLPNEPLDPRVPPYRQGAYGYWDDHPLSLQRFWPTAEYLAERCEMLTTLIPSVTTFYVEHRLLAQSLDDGFNWAAALHEAGIKLDAWTIDAHNPIAVANATRLLGAGVDQITTNTPTELAAALQAANTSSDSSRG